MISLVILIIYQGIPASATGKTLPGTIGGSALATTGPRSPAAIGASSVPAARRSFGGVGPVSTRLKFGNQSILVEVLVEVIVIVSYQHPSDFLGKWVSCAPCDNTRSRPPLKTAECSISGSPDAIGLSIGLLAAGIYRLSTEMKKGKRAKQSLVGLLSFFSFQHSIFLKAVFQSMVLLRFPGGSHLVRILQKFWSRQDHKMRETSIFKTHVTVNRQILDCNFLCVL